MRPAFIGTLLAACLGVTVGVTAAPHDWERRAPMPVPRTEVSAAVVGREIVVLGGLTLDRGASRRVHAYSPARDAWRRLPDLPIGVHHAMAVGEGGRLYVLGGYTAAGLPLRMFFVLERGTWRSLPRMPYPRAAAGAGVAGRRIVVAGGVWPRRTARPERALVRPAHETLVGHRGTDSTRASRGHSVSRHRLRSRRTNGRPGHEPPRLRELQARRGCLAQALSRA